MGITPSILLSLILLVFSPAAMSSALAPVANGHPSDVYIVFVSHAGYVDSVDYDLRLLASVVGSVSQAKEALLYHYSGLGFAARLTSKDVDKLSKEEGIAIFKDNIYHLEKDVHLTRFFEEHI